MQFFDSLVNLVSGLGTAKSKLASDSFTLVDRGPRELSAMYRGDWVARKIVDAPVFDMLREWRSWQASPELIQAIEGIEKAFQTPALIARAACMGRLYGGAVIVIGADVANPMMPLTKSGVAKGGIKYLTVLSRHAVQVPEVELDPRSPNFNKPKWFEVSTNTGETVRLHPSRCIVFLGNDRLDEGLAADGWSDSALLSVYDAVHHAGLTRQGIAELIHEAKLDVISIPNLGTQLATTNGTEALTKRFANANILKSINNMLLLDDKEKYDRKQMSFAGLPDVLDRYLQIVAAAADMPPMRFLSASAKGLNNSGSSELTNYYDMLSGLRKKSITPQLEYLDQVLWVAATGSVPRDAFFEWRPMWQMTPKEKADIAKTKAETTKTYAELGVLDEGALRQGVQNQLVEDAVYPGLEAAIASFGTGGDDPLEISSEEPGDDPAADRSNDNVRKRPLQITRQR